MKPTIAQIEAFAKSQGVRNYSIAFIAKMEAKGWKSSAGKPLTDWRTAYRFFVKRHEADLMAASTEDEDHGPEMLANAMYGVMAVFAIVLMALCLYLAAK